ncbi:hypothetical protein F5876DRAFT_81959 [Lentinula aff. lateritia]|uniref:Uncharacterized protein n=1 Tax=Lentinula aff. lateritia TaxID=2804960 RepID=A0ACC1TKP7_9AGAR|nr:hypothetical protein F5876DRAFT_81959 [Lentinula aff. lateritia]
MSTTTPTSWDLLPRLILYRELSRLKPTSTTVYNDSTLTFLASTTHPTQRSHGPPWTFWEPLQGSHLATQITTRSFLSSVVVPIASFELQLAPSMLQHKTSHTKPNLKTNSDPGLTPGPWEEMRVKQGGLRSAPRHENPAEPQNEIHHNLAEGILPEDDSTF